MKKKTKKKSIVNLEKKIKEKTISHEECMYEWLQDSETQIAYLNEALKENDIKLFLIALKDVIEARCGSLGVASKKSKLNRQNLYKMLSKNGNPHINTVSKLLNSIGINLYVKAESNNDQHINF